VDGFLLVDKPRGWSSRHTMNVLQRRLKVKGGYEGTLDPFATGLLLVGVGKATRFFPFFSHLLKEYVATLKLSEETDTLDPEGEVVETVPVPPLKEEKIREVLKGFVGEIEQIPPKFSALKVKGRRAYDLARSGQTVRLKPRRVYVESLELISFEGEVLRFRCRVGRGTYVRSLARDIAESLGTVGHLIELRRTAVGRFRVKDAKEPQEITHGDIIPVEEALYWMGTLKLDDEVGRKFLNGMRLRISAPEGFHRVWVGERFVGVGRVTGGILKPERLLPRRLSLS